MKRLLLVGALAASALSSAPAMALNCPAGTTPATLPTGTGYCKPWVQCDPMACPSPKEILQDAVACPTDIPVWSATCRSVFGD